MGDDFFFAAPSGPPQPQQPGSQQPSPYTPPGEPAPGMPGFSGYQSEQVRAQVLAEAGPAVPLSSANVVSAVAGFGALLMLVGAWGPWLKLAVFNFSDTAGGLKTGLNGRYVLALGIAALLTAGTALTSGQSSVQIRQICAGVLVAMGAIGLVIVIHDWVTISDKVDQLNTFAESFAQQFSQFNGAASGDPFLSAFDGVHVSRGWGLWLSGIASSVTGLAGAYLFLVKQP